MDKIIEKLLQQPDTEIRNDISSPETNQVATGLTDEKITKSNNPDYFEVETGCLNAKNINDFNFENKTRGFFVFRSH